MYEIAVPGFLSQIHNKQQRQQQPEHEKRDESCLINPKSSARTINTTFTFASNQFLAEHNHFHKVIFLGYHIVYGAVVCANALI